MYMNLHNFSSEKKKSILSCVYSVMLTLLSRSSVLLNVTRPKLELRCCLLELPSSPPNVLSASLKFSLVLIKPLPFLQSWKLIFV